MYSPYLLLVQLFFSILLEVTANLSSPQSHLVVLHFHSVIVSSDGWGMLSSELDSKEGTWQSPGGLKCELRFGGHEKDNLAY